MPLREKELKEAYDTIEMFISNPYNKLDREDSYKLLLKKNFPDINDFKKLIDKFTNYKAFLFLLLNNVSYEQIQTMNRAECLTYIHLFLDKTNLN